MPYISIKAASDKSILDDAEQTVKEFTENMSIILGKGTDTIMVNLQNSDTLFLGGKKLSKGALVKIMVFGDTSNTVKSKANDYICAFLKSKVNIPQDAVYVIFADKSEWGYKGNFISK